MEEGEAWAERLGEATGVREPPSARVRHPGAGASSSPKTSSRGGSCAGGGAGAASEGSEGSGESSISSAHEEVEQGEAWTERPGEAGGVRKSRSFRAGRGGGAASCGAAGCGAAGCGAGGLAMCVVVGGGCVRGCSHSSMRRFSARSEMYASSDSGNGVAAVAVASGAAVGRGGVGCWVVRGTTVEGVPWRRAWRRS